MDLENTMWDIEVKMMVPFDTLAIFAIKSVSPSSKDLI